VPVITHSGNAIASLRQHSSNGTGAGPPSSSTAPSEMVHPRKRKRSFVGLDRDHEAHDIDTEGSHRLPVRFDDRPSSFSTPNVPASHAAIQQGGLDRAALNYARAPLFDSVQPQPTRASNTPRRFRHHRPISQNHPTMQNAMASSHQSDRSPAATSPQASMTSHTPRRPLADLNVLPGLVTASSFERTGSAQLNGPSHSHAGSVDARTPHIALAFPAPAKSAAPTHITSPTPPASGQSTILAPMQHTNSNPEGSAQSSSSTDNGSSDSTDRTSVSVAHTATTSRSSDALVQNPVAAPGGLGNANSNHDGSFLVPMIRPTTVQRSWTAVVSRSVKYFMELSADFISASRGIQ
jgi:hypothetical protein